MRKTGLEGPKVKQRCTSTLSLTSALDGVGSQGHAPAALPPVKTGYPFYRRLVREGDYNFSTPEERKIIKLEQDFLYATE